MHRRSAESAAGRKRMAAVWRDERTRRWLLQGVIAIALIALAIWLGSNLDRNLTRLNLAFGFRFLRDRASFDIGETVVAYSRADTYTRAIWVGLLNSLRVTAAGLVLATLLGTAIGIARLSSNWLARTLARTYVEVLRNTPLLLQLLFWYFVAFVRGDVVALPGKVFSVAIGPDTRFSLEFALAFLTPFGLTLPALQVPSAWPLWAIGIAAIAIASNQVWPKLPRPRWFAVAGAFAAITVILAISIRDAPFLEIPQIDAENPNRVVGGFTLSPEFSALLVGLTLYTAAFIAEIVRAGLESVPRGQWEAARALGLQPPLVLRLVVFPQALRAIVPPLTGEYLNLWKNSSLAIVVGYPDLYFVASTTFSQTGRAVEVMLLLGLAYLSISVVIAGVANWVNRAILPPT